MTALPIWAGTRLGRALITEITAERPSCYVTSGDPFNCGGRTVYRGKLAARLRRMHKEWRERQLAALDAHFDATGEWDEAASALVFGAEDADALIGRVLDEAEQKPARAAA